MTRSNQNIPREDDRYIAGDTAVLELTIEKDDGTPEKINSADIVFAVAKYSGGDVLIEKSTEGNINIVDPENGRVDIYINSSDTKPLGGIDGYEYYYEIAVKDGKSDVVTVTTGIWEIYPDTAAF